MTAARESAAREYRAVVGELTRAAEALRARDRDRAAQLRRALVDLDAAMARAEERAALSRVGVELRWEQVLEALWQESWMTLRPRPQPHPRANPARLDALDAEAERAAEAVLEAVRRRVLGLGPR